MERMPELIEIPLDRLELHEACNLVRTRMRANCQTFGFSEDEERMVVDQSVSAYIHGRVRRTR